MLCANDVAVTPGRAVYTAMLNDRGGFEADLTVTRLSEDAYMVVTGCSTETRDEHWIRQGIPADAHAFVTNVSSAYAVLGVMGPRSRELLSRLTDTDLSNEAFPFLDSREIELGYAPVRATRITYVGELGWELYIPTEFAAHVYDAIVAEGGPFGLRLAGYHALESLRMEKAYRAWGTDLTDLDTPLEAGLRFAVAFDKPGLHRQEGADGAGRQGSDEAAGSVHAGRPRAAAARRRADLPRRRARRPHYGRRLRPHGRPIGGHGIHRGRERRQPGLRPWRQLRDRDHGRAPRGDRVSAPPLRPPERARTDVARPARPDMGAKPCATGPRGRSLPHVRSRSDPRDTTGMCS